jgi:catechol 2,3-dioxygenase-like lactoylglutathione lyase family enzyme
MPAITRVLETALYFEDLPEAVAFYVNVMGLRVLDAGSRLVSIDAGQSTVLLLFKRGATMEGAQVPGGRIPPHDGGGPVHVAFAVAADALEGWEQHLLGHGVTIESRVGWDGGGRSIYIRDPEGHSLELATPGTWATY